MKWRFAVFKISYYNNYLIINLEVLLSFPLET